MLPTGKKIAPDEILQTTSCKCVSTPSAINIDTDVSELDSTVQSSVVINKVIITLTCTWMIMKLRIKIIIVKVAQKMINLLDTI